MHLKTTTTNDANVYCTIYFVASHNIVKTIHYDNPWVRFLSRNGANQEPLASEDV